MRLTHRDVNAIVSSAFLTDVAAAFSQGASLCKDKRASRPIMSRCVAHVV